MGAYAKNPFDNVTAEELDEYRRIIDAKSRMGGALETPVPDSSTLENTTGGDHTFNGGGGDGTDGNATFCEGDTSKATDTDLSHMSPKKEKKKKSGLRTPSFPKKKKKKRGVKAPFFPKKKKKKKKKKS